MDASVTLRGVGVECIRRARMSLRGHARPPCCTLGGPPWCTTLAAAVTPQPDCNTTGAFDEQRLWHTCSDAAGTVPAATSLLGPQLKRMTRPHTSRSVAVAHPPRRGRTITMALAMAICTMQRTDIYLSANTCHNVRHQAA